MNLSLPLNQLGYGIVGTNLAVEIKKILNDVCIWPLGPVDCDPEYIEIIKENIANVKYFNHKDSCYKLFHANQMIMNPSKGMWTGSTFFELDTLNEMEVAFLNTFDIIFAFGKWSEQVMIENGVKSRIENIAIGVDKRYFYPRNEQKDPDKTVFINCGKWEKRKGHDVLVEAFNRAFDVDSNVELWMMNDNPFLPPEEQQKWIDLYKNSKLGNKIKMVKRVPHQQDVANIFAKVNCGVFPSRAEGWNLECAELMAMGKDIITTNCTAHTEYCNEENSMLIDVPEKELAFDGKWFYNQGNWHKFAEPQIQKLADYMREYHKSNKKTNINGIITMSDISYRKSAQTIVSCME